MKEVASFNMQEKRVTRVLLWITLLNVTSIIVIVDTCTDTGGVVKDGKTCAQLSIPSANSECYDSTVETQCCASCTAVATNVAGCNYGDSATSCFDFLCPGLVDPSVCCSTCNVVATTTTSTTSSITPSTSQSTSSTTSSTTLSTTSTTSSTSSLLSTQTVAVTNVEPEQSHAGSDNENINVGLILGSVFGGVVTAIVVVIIIIIGAKLYKRSKRQVDPNVDDLPDKRDTVSAPEQPTLYSTPTMVVIDTTEDEHPELHEKTKTVSDKETKADRELKGVQETGKRVVKKTHVNNDHNDSVNTKSKASVSTTNTSTAHVWKEGKSDVIGNSVDKGYSVDGNDTDTLELARVGTNLRVEDIDHNADDNNDEDKARKFDTDTVKYNEELLASKIEEEEKFMYPNAD